MPIDPLIQSAAARFAARFGRPPRCAAAAPGRVNLIGEHTDYNDGFVLPMAIDRYTVAVATVRPRSDNRVTIVSDVAQGEATFAIDAALAPGEPRWANYIKGVVAGCRAADINVPGFDAVITSDVPLGGGLSSSASLEVAVATLIEAMTGRSLDPVDKALLCQRAEHDFAGMPCGIMDQFISAMGRQDHAMLLDCRSHVTRHVPLDDPDVSVLIINTNVKHELTGSEYPQRRAQCEAAAKQLGAPSLREVSMKQLVAAKPSLDPAAYKRAYHVVGEIARTLQAAAEIEAGSWFSVGRLMLKSHDALRDHFEVSCRELDLLVDLARARVTKTGGVFGSRMTGGGFGGCAVTLVRTAQRDEIAADLCKQYEAETGIVPTAFTTRPAAGAAIVPLPD
jgi:galactokinase